MTRSEGGGSRPSRSKSSIGARRRRWEDEDVAPRRKELRKRGERPDESAVERRIRDQDSERPSYGPSAGSGRRERPDDRGPRRQSDRFADRAGGRATRSERSDAPRPSRRDLDEGDRPQRRQERFDRERPDDRPQRRQERTFDRPDDRPSPTSFDRTDRPDHRRSPRTDRDDRTDQPDRPARPARFTRRDDTESRPQKPTYRDRAPDSLPYTTAASEFIYGYSSVLAALRANRRQFYALYVNARGLNRDILLARAKASNLRRITREVGDQYDRAFDKASSGRPHNGFILEASPLPAPPISELAPCVKETGTFTVVLAPQTKEEAAVNGTRTTYPYASSSWRHPLLLYLDGILDEGNLGAIARSAYLLGVDAILTPTRQSAPWSHIALKASAGAAESVPIFRVPDPSSLLGTAARNGWRCYAAAALPPSSSSSSSPAADSSTSNSIHYTLARSSKPLPPSHSPVAEHPTILMLGAEGSGLKTSLLNIAHYNVGIRHGRVDDVGVDSLNVSVAAGLLCFDVLRRREVVVRDEANVVF